MLRHTFISLAPYQSSNSPRGQRVNPVCLLSHLRKVRLGVIMKAIQIRLSLTGLTTWRVQWRLLGGGHSEYKQDCSKSFYHTTFCLAPMGTGGIKTDSHFNTGSILSKCSGKTPQESRQKTWVSDQRQNRKEPGCIFQPLGEELRLSFSSLKWENLC